MDLYFNDVYALYKTLMEVEEMQTHSTLRGTSKTESKYAHRLCLLSEMLQPTSESPANYRKRKELMNSFPGLNALDTNAPRPHFNIEFLMSSLPISFEMEKYLERCDKGDHRVKHVEQMVDDMYRKRNTILKQIERTNYFNEGHYSDKLTRIRER